MGILIFVILKLHYFISLLDSSNKFFFLFWYLAYCYCWALYEKKDLDGQEDSQEEGQVWQRTSYLALGLLL